VGCTELLSRLRAANARSDALEARVATLTAELEAAVSEGETERAAQAAPNYHNNTADASSEEYAQQLAELRRKHEEVLREENDRCDAEIAKLRAERLSEVLWLMSAC
jgi:hypothetical protein